MRFARARYAPNETECMQFVTVCTTPLMGAGIHRLHSTFVVTLSSKNLSFLTLYAQRRNIVRID
jgi:hypothetical protein